MAGNYPLKHTGRYWEIGAGEIGRFSCINKFGRNPDVDMGTAPEDIWSQGGTYTYLTAAAAMFLSSSNGGDTVNITVQGLDTNWDFKEETVALTGQTQVVIPGTYIRVFRAFNASSNMDTGQGTDLLGDVYIAETDTLTGGVPDTATKIKAKIDQLFQQTHMTHYSIARWHTGYLTKGYMTMNSGNQGATILDFAMRQFGGVFRSQFVLGVDESASSTFQYEYPVPQIILAKTDIKVVAVSVGKDNTDISAGFQVILEDNRGDM